MKRTIEDMERDQARRIEEDRLARERYERELTPTQISDFIAKKVKQARDDAPLAADLLAALLRVAGRRDLAEKVDHINTELKAEEQT